MKPLNFTIIKLTACLIAGIMAGYFCKVTTGVAFNILIGPLILLTVTYFIVKKQVTKTIWFGVFAFITMICVGILIVAVHNPKSNPRHYSHFITSKNDSLTTITFRIRDVLKPSPFYNKYIVDILNTNGVEVSGRSILNIRKDSLKNPLYVDEIFITKAIFKSIIPPLNPGQFDYKLFLERKYIYHQLFTTNTNLLKVTSQKQTLLGMANKIREYINSKLKTHSFKPDELAIINAILLGQRQNINEDVYTNYANAGAIHILAVSGLHIGIILMILSFIFKPLEQLRYGLFIKTVLLLILLWGFAIIAGLSASVTRAVTLFSILAIGMHLKRPANVYNTLAISVFVLLLFKPMFLFDVGFQLSYFAVLGIISIDPYLYNLWRPNYWLIRIYWHTFTVTIAAQLGIIPVSLYYFHQFPGLFFLSNLLIVPLLGILLGLGILVILLALINMLPHLLADLFGNLISFMNDIIDWIAQQETFLIKNISFSVLFVIASYFFIISLVRFVFMQNYKRLALLLIAIIFSQGVCLYTKFDSLKKQFLVFHKSRYSLLANTQKSKMIIAHNFDSVIAKKDKVITDYSVKNHIKNISKDTLRSVYVFGPKSLLVVDSLGIYNVKSFKPDFVLLRNSPKINLNRLIETLHPSLIIADGSNYKTFIQRWKATCYKTKIPFHQTSEKGAFIIDY